MRHIKLFFACMLMAVLSIGQVWATDFTLSSAAEVTKDGITVTFAKGDGSNAPAWYAAGLRLYVKNTVTITSTSNITAISFNWEKQGSKAFASVTASTGSYSHPTAAGEGTWSGSAKSITFTLGGSGQLQLNTFSVTTDGGGSSDPTLSVDPTVIDFGTVEQNAVVASQTVEVSFANLTGSVSYSGLTSPFSATGTISTTGDEITIAANTATAGDYSQTLTVQSTADSKSQDVTVKMKVVAPLTPIAGGIVDELLISDFEVTGGYTAFTDKQASNTGHSDAVYAGTVARNGNATKYNIQLNSGQTSSKLREIATSTSGGYAKRVRAIWATQTANTANRKLTVYGSESAYTGSETVATGTNLGDLTYETGDPYAYIDIAGDYPYIQIVANGAIYMDQINVTWVANTATVAKPVISGTESFLSSTAVSITCDTEGATIYYTTDGTDPKTSESKQSGTSFTLYNSATVRAIANKGSDWSAEATSKTFTKITPLTVAEAIALIPNKDDVVNDQYVAGIVCTAAPSLLSGGKLTYYISADGSETNRLQIYKGKNLNNTEFTAVSDLAIGDRVTVFGQLKNFNNTPEMNDGNYLVSKEGPAVAAPVFSPDGGGFMGETDVTITCATGSSTIYYTLDGATPTKSSSVYDDPIHLNATTTITAVAYVGDDASLVIAKTFTLTAPMTVADALTALDTEDPINNVAVAGIISTAPSSNPSSGKLTYFISDDGSASDELEVYLGYGLNGASFSAKTDLQVGDEVTVFGNLTIFNSTTKEFASGSRLLAFNRPEVAVSSVSLPATETVEAGSTVTLTATVLPDNATDKSITWSVQSGSTYASVADGVVSGLIAGEAVIRAASTADPTIYDECTVTVTAADPTKHVVTFDATVDAGESPLLKSNISMACSNGALDNESEYRLYKSSTTTFECSVGNIIKIEFTGVSGNPVSGFGDPEVGTLVTEGNDGVWTGNAASVSFVASGAQVRATKIKVTYKEDNREDADLEWSTDAIVLTVGDAFTPANLVNPNGIAAGEITIESDNTDLAIVTAGVVSLVADATGEATITATFAGNEDYKPAVVSYTITVNEAGLDNVTFDATLDVAETSELSISKSGFTLGFTSGALDNGENYRLYKSQTMTLSSTDYLIKKIEFTCTSGNPISGFADAEGLDKANNQWTGETNSVELTASNAQVRIEKLKVYYIDDARAASGLAWSANEVEITLGDAFTPANLVNPNSIDASAITIESDNTDLAVVNDGVVSLVADATGTAHITATFAGNATYKPANISYTITVNDPNPEISTDVNSRSWTVDKDAAIPADKTFAVTLKNITSATVTLGGTNPDAFSITPATLTASGNITVSVVSTATVGTYTATITIKDDASETSKVVNVNLTVNEPEAQETSVSTTSEWVAAEAADLVDGAEVLITGATGGVTYAIGVQNDNNRAAVAGTLEDDVFTPGENTMSFTLVAQETEGVFALQASNGEYLYAASSTKNYLKRQATLDDNAKWTLTATSAVANGSNTHNDLKFNATNSPKIFSCYTGGQTAIQFYVPKSVEPVLNWEDGRTGLTAGKYYTICLPKKVTHFRGASVWNMNKRNAAETEVYLEEAALPFAAGTPFIIQATADKLEVVYEGAETSTPVESGALRGTLTGLDVDAFAALGGNIYILKDNAIRPRTTGNWLSANRAYIDYDELIEVSEAPTSMPGKKVRKMPMQPQTPTGLDELNAGNQPMKVMINGQLYILRGEKMYNANGQVVK